MATLKTLAIDKLMLRGNGNEFNSFGRMFNSLKMQMMLLLLETMFPLLVKIMLLLLPVKE